MHFLKATILALSSAFAVNASRISSCTEPNTIALTFDDGPFDYTTDLLDELKAANIHATFFINGYNYWHDLETNPEKQAVLTRAVNEGHQIASHTWRHQIPVNETDIEPMMKRLDDVIEKATGYRPKYFRAPKGDIGADTVKFFEDLGYKVIQWDTDTNDWDFKTIGAEARVKLVKEFLTKEFAEKRESYLVLMHDVNDHTVHQIASHTWRHQIPVNETDIEPMMKRLDDVIEKATGYRPKYFRAPKGDIGADTVKFFEDLGYKVIQWDTDTNDWDFKTIGAEARVKLVKEFLTKEFAEKKRILLSINA